MNFVSMLLAEFFAGKKELSINSSKSNILDTHLQS